jgi:pimeloyl-ACP methyl ester carboxylesterase
MDLEKDICIIEGAGHWVHYDKPKETIIAIKDFLSRLDKN